jgi:Glycosyltransferase family 87
VGANAPAPVGANAPAVAPGAPGLPAAAPPRRRRRNAVARARLWLTAAAVAGYLPALGVPFRRWLDFAAFYAGGQLSGTSHLLDPVAVVLLQASQGLPPTPFVSPPFVALAYAPMSALPYDLAAVIQVAVMLAALLAGAAFWGDALGLPRRWAVLGALAWGPASASVVSGQLDTLALLLTGLAVRALTARRPIPAGVAIALLAIKPQVTIGAGLGALQRLGSRGIAALLGVGAVLYGLSAVASGGDAIWPQRWIAALTDYSHADFQANGWQASSPVSLGVRWWLGSDNPLFLGLGVAVAALVVGAVLGILAGPRARANLATAFGASGPALEIAIATALWLVVSPHLWVYDATLLLPAVGLWVVVARAAGWPARDVALIASTFGAAALWPIGGVLGLTDLPLIVAGVPLALARAIGLLGHVPAEHAPAIFPTNSST